MSVVAEIKCPHCNAPLSYKPGEVLFTCKYCGFTGYIDLTVQFKVAHSILEPKLTREQVEEIVHDWMKSGFAKPRDLAKKAKIVEEDYVLVPFWLISVKATTTYRGLLERTGAQIEKSGKIDGDYDWFVVAREGIDLPPRIFDLPLEARRPFELSSLPSGIEALNAELDLDEAKSKVEHEIEVYHVERAKENVDTFIDQNTTFEFGDAIYVHAPLWFFNYEYRGSRYRMIIDGSEGRILLGELPPIDVGIL